MPDAVPWHVRIFGSSAGVPVGAGVYVGERKILTCAHVIEDALGLADITTPPTGQVTVDFPQSTDRQRRPAAVICGAWFPKGDQAGDVAVLQIVGEDISPALTAPLRFVGSPAPRTIEVLGHPVDQLDGVWARARIIEPDGSNIEWMQMDIPTLTGTLIQPSFCGAGVIDEEDGTVIGWVVAVDTTVEYRIAWMIPTDVMARYWPELRPMCRAPYASTQRRSRKKREVRSLSPQLQRLAALLHTHSAIRRREDRRLHISILEREFDDRLQVARSDIDRSDDDYDATLAIVAECASHPGALHSLRKQLARFQSSEDTDVFPAIEAVIGAVDPTPLLTAEERNRLYRLLDAIDPHVRADMVIRSYQEAVSPFSQSDIDPLDLPSVVRQLESATAVSDDVPQLIHFIETLCRRLPVANVADLHQWMDEFGQRDGISYQILRLRRSTEPLLSRPVISYILTEIEPHGNDSERYRPRITLQQAAQSGELINALPLYPTPDRAEDAVAWSEIRELFDSALSRVWATSAALVSDLVVEFLLPFPLLNEAVDQWKIETSGAAHVVGVDHDLVIRIWNRVANVHLLNRSMSEWREKSSRLSSDSARVWWVDPYDTKYVRGGKLYVDLSPGGEPCLGLSRAPRLPPAPGSDAVSIGIRTGVPAMIWCRKETLSEPFVSLVREYVSSHGLSRLPSFIRELRRQSVRSDDPLGANITLVWDTADRHRHRGGLLPAVAAWPSNAWMAGWLPGSRTLGPW